MRVTTQINLETISFPDKLKFKPKDYIRNQRQFIDDEGNFVNETSFESQINMFPKWYTHPTSIVTENDGIFSYFDPISQYLEDGWEGGHYGSTSKGEYLIDPTSGLRYLLQEHTQKSRIAYDEVNFRVNSYGVLYRFVWKYPKTTYLSLINGEGQNVTQTSNEIIISNGQYEFTWNLLERTLTRKYFENSQLVKTIFTVYTFDNNIGIYLLNKHVEIIPGIFDNGDCFETINTTTYENYDLSCSESIQFRESDLTEHSFIKLYPNPSNDILNYDYQCIDCKNVKVFITNSIGEMIIMKDYEITKGAVNISSFPVGLYVLTVLDNGKEYSSKFVKN